MKIARRGHDKTPIAAFLFALLMLLPLLAATTDPRDASVDQDMDRLKKAMLNKEPQTLVDMMYGPVVEAGGGREQLIAQAKALTNIASYSVLDIIKPYTYVSGVQNDYVIIPTHVILSVRGRQFDYKSYELGIKPHRDGKWEYLDGTGITSLARDRFLPDFPASSNLPEVQKREINEEKVPIPPSN